MRYLTSFVRHLLVCLTLQKRSEIAKEKSNEQETENEINYLRMSTQVIQGQVQESEMCLRKAQHQLRDLTINIK